MPWAAAARAAAARDFERVSRTDAFGSLPPSRLQVRVEARVVVRARVRARAGARVRMWG